MLRVSLTNNMGFRWHKTDNLYAKGWVFINGKLLSNESFLDFLNARGQMSLCEIAQEIDDHGQYVIIRTNNNRAEILTDSTRSFPIFYQFDERSVFVHDNWVEQQGEIDQTASIEYQTCGYVTGSRSLYRGWCQLQSSEYIEFSIKADGLVAKKTLRRHAFSRDISAAYDWRARINEIIRAFDSIANQMYELSRFKNIVIPLSGGFDSRLIAVMCKKAGIDNVVAFSYGIPSNAEALISAKVAKKIGFNWRFVEYTNDKWRRILDDTALFSYCRSMSAIPHIQDMIAAKELSNSGIINTQSVIVPGHSGDFIGGSHLPHFFRFRHVLSRKEIVHYIFLKHYTLSRTCSTEHASQLKSIIEQQLEIPKTVSIATAVQRLESWDLAERQSKYIVNSVRGYEYRGCTWYCPLYDGTLLQAMQPVKIQDAIDTYLYRQAIRYYCSDVLGDEFTYGATFRPTIQSLMKYLAHTARIDELIKNRKSAKFMNCPIHGDGSTSFLGALAAFDLEAIGRTPNQ